MKSISPFLLFVCSAYEANGTESEGVCGLIHAATAMENALLPLAWETKTEPILEGAPKEETVEDNLESNFSSTNKIPSFYQLLVSSSRWFSSFLML